MEKIKIGIVGYGNLGKGVEKAVMNSKDLELAGVFTRRKDMKTESGVASYLIEIAENFKDKIDVMVMCGGSAKDLPVQSPEMLKNFNIVDSFDNHGNIPMHFDVLNEVGKQSGKCGLVSVGWDPGLFSLARAVFSSILPDGNEYTFWGKGVSQGHSDAIRKIAGVKNAVQYTIPKEEALMKVLAGENPDLSVKDKHLRECFVVALADADKAAIENSIKTMPNYFDGYDTVVHFITEEEFNASHTTMPHGGKVIRSGKTASGDNQLLELSIKLDSNPDFTGAILTAYARAIAKFSKMGNSGAFTCLDVPIGLLSEKPSDFLRKTII